MHKIGKELKERMDMLKVSVEDLAQMTFLDKTYIEGIINNSVLLENIDEFDLGLITSALHCSELYFSDKQIRNRDLLVASKNRGIDDTKSRMVKAKLQDYLNDYAMVLDVLNGEGIH